MGFLKKIRLIVKYMVMYLSMLMPRNKRIMVFGAWLGDKFADNAKMLFLEAQEDKDIDAVWISGNPRVVKEVRKAGYRAYGWCSLKGIHYQLRAGYAIMTNGISDFKHAFLGGTVLINLWHGIPLKKIGYDDFYEKDWNSRKQRLRDKIIRIPLGREYVVATSPVIAKIYKSAFRVPESRIICLGQPRNDVFFDKSLRKRAAKAGNGICHGMGKTGGASGKKGTIILYAPTHRKEGKVPVKLSHIFDLEKLNDFCEKNNCYFLVKKHFYHRKEREDLSRYKRLWDITNKSCDSQELLMAADVLITDYSSIYIDYLLLDKPMLFYHYDLDEYLKRDREMYFKYEEVSPGERAGNFEGFMEGLSRIIKSRGEGYREDRKRVRDIFYCKNGQKAVGRKLLEIIKSL